MQTLEANMKEKVQAAWSKRPLVISGPCSAETEEQLVATAQQLAATGKVDILRAGIWKPRTKPGMFEGIGAKGLPWLQKAKQFNPNYDNLGACSFLKFSHPQNACFSIKCN